VEVAGGERGRQHRRGRADGGAEAEAGASPVLQDAELVDVGRGGRGGERVEVAVAVEVGERDARQAPAGDRDAGARREVARAVAGQRDDLVVVGGAGADRGGDVEAAVAVEV